MRAFRKTFRRQGGSSIVSGYSLRHFLRSAGPANFLQSADKPLNQLGCPLSEHGSLLRAHHQHTILSRQQYFQLNQRVTEVPPVICGTWLRNPGTTHPAPFTSLIATNAKNANRAGGYEGRALSRWDGARGSSHCLPKQNLHSFVIKRLQKFMN